MKGYQEVKRIRGVRTNREDRANMLEEERTAETGSVCSDRDDVAF